MTFDTKITLADYTPPKGSVAGAEKTTATVWANVSIPGVTVQYSAAAADRKAEMQAIMWRSEYHGENRVVIGDKHYRVDAEGPAQNKRQIKLILSRVG